MKKPLVAAFLLGWSAIHSAFLMAQEPMLELKIDLPKQFSTFEGRPAVPSDAGKFVVPGAGRARFTYSGNPMVDKYQLFGLSLSFPGSANTFFPGQTVESNERDQKYTVGQPFVWIKVQEFSTSHAGMEISAVLKPRFNYQSATGQSYPVQSALFRIEWLGGQGGSPADSSHPRETAGTGSLPATTASPASPTAAGDARFPLRAGRTLVIGQKIFSASGNHYLVFQADGNLVVYTAGNQYVWGLQSVTDRYAQIKQVHLQTDGNLAAYGTGNAYIWSALTRDPDASAYLDLSPKGVLRLVSGNTGAVLWSSSP